MSDIFYEGQKRYTKQIIELDPEVKFHPIKGTIWIEDLEHGATTKNGLYIPSDSNVTSTRLSLAGIHPRWATVFAVADDLKDEFTVGDKIYLKHGCWTDSFDFLINGNMKKLWLIPKKDVLFGVLAKEV